MKRTIQIRIKAIQFFLAAVLLAVPSLFAQTTVNWSNPAIVTPTMASTATSPNLTVSGGTWAVGDVIRFTGTTTALNPFGTTATRYYVVSVAGSVLQVATTPGGTAVNAANTTTVSPASQAQDWFTTANWTGGVAPNSNTTIASLANPNGNAGTVINGNAVVYGLIDVNSFSGSDLTLVSGGNGTSRYPLTFGTTDATVPKMSLSASGNFLLFLGTSGADNMPIKINGTQGLSFNSMPGGALTGSGTAATCSNPAKQLRLVNVDWTGFSGGLQIERGYIQPSNAGQFPSPAQGMTVGNAQTIANSLLAGFNLNGQSTSVDALNGNSLGRVWGNATLTVGAVNGSGTYSGVIGKDFTGTTYATAVTKTGSGIENISGPIVGTGAVTVNGAGGTLILSGANTYSGITTVTAGKLVVSTAQTGTGAFTVANGATLDVSVSGTSQLVPTTLTMSSTATTLEYINLASTTTAPLKPGTLALNGTVTVNINSGTFSPGNSYPLVNWTSISGAGGFVLGNCAFAASLSTNSSTLMLNIPVATTNVWTGASSGNWDTTTTGNWTGGTGIYADGGVALFNDTATGTTNITVNQALVKPGLAVFNNSSLSYFVTSGSSTVIGGGGSVSVIGGGMVTLTGPNTYSGGTTLSAGQLNLNYGGSSSANSAIGTGVFTISGGTLDNTSTGDVSLLPAIAQNWNGDFAYVGSIHNLNLGAGAITLGSNRIVSITNNTLTVGGVIGDGGAGYALTKNGNGALVLNGANTFSGGATLNAGTVQVGNSTALGSGGSQLGAGVLDLNGVALASSNNVNSSAFVLTNTSASAASLAGNTKVNNSFTIGVGVGSIAVARLIDVGSPQTVTKTGAGTLTFNGAGHNNLMEVVVNGGTALFANTGGLTADRGVILNSGTIKLNAVGNGSGKNADLINNSSAPFTVNSGTFDLNGWNETVPTISGTGGLILNNAAGNTNTLTVGGDTGINTYYGSLQNGAGVLALTVINGTQTLANTNTYTGGTIISSGTLQAGTNNVLPTAGGDVTVTGTLDLNTFTNALNGLNGAGIVDTVAGGSPVLTVGVNGDGGSFYGTIQNSSGTLSLVKTGAGIQTLAGANNYAGTTTISNGTLVIGSSLSGSGAVTVYGPGVLNASNSPSVSGAVTLAGTNATLSLLDGTINTLSLSGGLSLTSSNVLKFEISSAGLDQVVVSGAFAQAGKAVINLSQINAPNAGTYPLIANASGINAGNFVLGNSLSGYALSLTSDGSNLYLVVSLNAPATAYWHNITGTTWTGHTGANYNWDTDASSGINANAPPAASSDVFFAASAANNFNTTLGADFSVKSLTFNVANNVTIGGAANTLTLDGPLTVNSGAGASTVSVSNVVLGADQNISVADSGNTLKITSAISGPHAFNVSGAGTVSLSGSSTYTGNTTISSGTLALNNPTNTLPDGGAVNVNGGTLSIGTNNDTVGAVTLTSGNITGVSGVLTGSSYNVQNGTVSASLGGTAAMTMTGGSVLLAGNSTYSGGTTLSSGTLQLGASNALGVSSATIATGTTLDLNGQTIANQLIFSGAATLANNGAAAAVVNTDATLNNNPTIDTTGGDIAVARLIGGTTRTVTKTGANTLTFKGAGHNNLVKLVVQGGTVVCANNGGFSADRGFELDFGTVKLGGPGSGGSYPNANLFNDSQQFWVLGGTFDLNGWNETVATVVGNNSTIENSATGTNSTLSLGSDNLTGEYSGTMQDAGGILSITKVGTGVQTLSGANTYSGNTTLNNGQLLVTASAASPNSTFVVNTNGGLVFHNDTVFAIGGLSGGGNESLLNDGSSPVTLSVGANNVSTTYSGVLSDGGAGATVTKVGTGTLTLSGSNTYSGLTTVSAGVLVISPNYIASGNFTVNEGAALGVSGNTPASSALVGTLTPGVSGSGTSAILFTSLPVPTNAPLTVATLSPVGGAGSVIISNNAALNVGTYNLINYTSLTGAGYSALALAPLPPGTSAHLVNNTAGTPKVIQLVVTAVAPQVWSGAVNTNWDINTTANWKLNGLATNYFDASPVLFDDSVGSGLTTVNLVTNVQPNTLTVSNNTKNFTFTTSAGKSINSLDGFNKSGTGTLTLVNLTNTFAGAVNINAGTVVLAASTLGNNGITDNGSLVFSNGTATVSYVVSGAGTLVQNGTNTVDLSVTNTYGGGTIIKSGTLQSDNPGSLGTGPITLGDGVSASSATLQASPTASFINTNPLAVAAGGTGVYAIQAINSGDYTLGGNVTLNNALTLRTTSNGALWLGGVITSGGSNPAITVDGGGATTKFVSFTSDNSSTFTGNLVITNSGNFKADNTNALSALNTVALDSTSIFDNGSRNLTIAGLNNFNGTGGTVPDAGGAGVLFTLGGGGTYSFSGVINNSGSLVKSGSGQQTLSGVNTYTGTTTVSNGTLIVNGSLAGGGAVTVAGGTLAGSGVLYGATTVAGGTLSPGVSGIGTLSVSNSLTLQSGGTLAMDINKTTGAKDQVAVLGAVTYGGTLAVNNQAGTLTTADSFKLFNAGSYAGAFAVITPSIPATGLVWNTNTLTTDGTLRVASGVNTNPTNITVTVSGNVLQLSWPADHTGWRLLVQTNNLAAGLSVNTNDWMTVPGSTGIDQTNITMDPVKPAEFYRLVYP